MTDNKPPFKPPLFRYNGIYPTVHPDTFIAQTAAVIGDTHIGEGSGILSLIHI